MSSGRGGGAYTKGTKGAIILPHGVLFRGNAEADIRRALVRKGYIKGIIGLPANLFYGTGIPACIIVIDKAGAKATATASMEKAKAANNRDYQVMNEELLKSL